MSDELMLWISYIVRAAVIVFLVVLVPEMLHEMKRYFQENGLSFYRVMVTVVVLLFFVFMGFRWLDNSYPKDPRILDMVKHGGIYGR